MKSHIGTFLIRACILSGAALCLASLPAAAQQFKLTGHAEVHLDDEPSKKKDNSEVVVWLDPAQSSAKVDGAARGTEQTRHFVLVQRDHTFVPHVLVVPVGSTVEVPNHDPVFHNAFSLFDGKRFDLGLYEAGTSRVVRLDKPGISYVFCNIHYQMSAIIVSLATPYYGVSGPDGTLNIQGVPPGQYKLNVWAEGASVETLNELSREVRVGGDSSLGTIRVSVMPALKMAHKNKYGKEYDPAASDSPYDSRSRQ